VPTAAERGISGARAAGRSARPGVECPLSGPREVGAQ